MLANHGITLSTHTPPFRKYSRRERTGKAHTIQTRRIAKMPPLSVGLWLRMIGTRHARNEGGPRV